MKSTNGVNAVVGGSSGGGLKKIAIKYESCDQFYESLPFNSITTTSKLKTSNKIPSRVYHAPLNQNALISWLDKNQRSCKRSIVAFSVILNDAYNLNVCEKRKLALLNGKRKSKENVGENVPAKKKQRGDGGKAVVVDSINNNDQTNSRVDCIPDVMKSCTSGMAKIAVAMYLFKNHMNDQIKKQMIYELSTNSESYDIEKLIDVYLNDVSLKTVFPCTDAAAMAGFYDTIGSVDELSCGTLIRAFLEVADLSRDRFYAKLAFDMSYKIYVETMDRYVKNMKFFSMASFDPIIRKYLEDNVSKLNKPKEQRVITNHFERSYEKAFTYLVKNTCYLNKVQTSSDTSAVASVKTTSNDKKNDQPSFQNDVQYEAFIGHTNYLKDLVFTFYEYGDKFYKISLYKDCLYDVYCYQSKDNNKDCGAFNDLPWSKRLQLIPMRMAVVVNEFSGEELNQLERVNGTITVSYKDDEHNYYCMKTYTLQKSYKKLIKCEAKNDE
jgi:hypothetical protein